MATGKEHKCQDVCKCRRGLEARMEHVGQIEAMAEVGEHGVEQGAVLTAAEVQISAGEDDAEVNFFS